MAVVIPWGEGQRNSADLVWVAGTRLAASRGETKVERKDSTKAGDEAVRRSRSDLHSWGGGDSRVPLLKKKMPSSLKVRGELFQEGGRLRNTLREDMIGRGSIQYPHGITTAWGPSSRELGGLPTCCRASSVQAWASSLTHPGSPAPPHSALSISWPQVPHLTPPECQWALLSPYGLSNSGECAFSSSC